MNLQTETASVHHVFALAQILSFLERCTLIARLNRDIDDNLPAHAGIEEALALYLAEKCSLGRAAELANVTRWDLLALLKKRNMAVVVDTDLTAKEMDALAEELEREGVLC